MSSAGEARSLFRRLLSPQPTELCISQVEGERRRRVVIECDVRPQSDEELHRRALLTHAMFSDPDLELEQIVLNLTGGEVAEDLIAKAVCVRRINLACMDAPEELDRLAPDGLPFVGLMRGASEDLVSDAVLMSLAQGGSTGTLLVNLIYDFAELGRGKEFVMAVQEKVQRRNLFQETLYAERCAGREEVREEMREEMRTQLREMLEALIAKKFPKHKLATIQKRLAPLAIEKLRDLGPRLLDDLSWSDFWKIAKP